MSTTSKTPENHPSPESPEPTQRELALAWIDRELEKARKANAPYEAAAEYLRSPVPKSRNVPDPGPDSGADHEDWVVEKYADQYEREQAEYLLYDDDPERDNIGRWLEELELDRDAIISDNREEIIELFAAKETARRDSESEAGSATV